MSIPSPFVPPFDTIVEAAVHRAGRRLQRPTAADLLIALRLDPEVPELVCRDVMRMALEPRMAFCMETWLMSVLYGAAPWLPDSELAWLNDNGGN